MLKRISDSLQLRGSAKKLHHLKIMATKTLELQMAKFDKDIEYTRERVSHIEAKIDAFHLKFDEFAGQFQADFVRKDEFIFWRNLIVGGLLSTISVGVIMILIKK